MQSGCVWAFETGEFHHRTRVSARSTERPTNRDLASRRPRTAKTAIIVLAGTESHADLGRVTNALTAAKEFDDAGDDVEIIFDGAGTQWIPELEDEDHPNHSLYQSLTDHVSVCDYCAGAFDVEDDVEDAPVETEAEFEGHNSVRDLVVEGYEVITY